MKKDKIEIGDKTFVKFISEDDILKRVEELATQIRNDYGEKNPVFIIIANGAMPFATDLILRANIESEYHCVKASSYFNNMESACEVELYMPLPDLAERDVIIVEDIVDSGYTMQALLKKMKDFNPISVEIATLLSKPDARKVEINPKYIGFIIEPLFIIGYGLDFAQKGRYLKDIFILEEKK
jgi:hypoxanthine phosphoribosyltransferase